MHFAEGISFGNALKKIPILFHWSIHPYTFLSLTFGVNIIPVMFNFTTYYTTGFKIVIMDANLQL